MADAPPPRPPPHGQNPRPPGAMPDGNYDIFIIPPHSAGSGFLYLPSLQPHRNSFLAGVACALLAVGIYAIAVPVLKQWISTVMAGGGGIGVLLLIAAIGVGGWALGKTQGESSNSNPNQGPGSGNTAPPPNGSHAPPPQSNGAPPNYGASSPPPPPRPDSKAPPANGTQSTWEKAREETKRREEERKRTEELRKKREEMAKAKEEAERAAKAKAEKEKWEQARAREKDQREREARERIARERAAREKDLKDKVTSATAAAAEKARSAPSRTSPNKPGAGASGYEKPTARSYAGTEDEFSYRPYDSQHQHHHDKRPQYKSSASSIISGLSEGSYAPSNGTSRTTPPPASQRGPYTTSDPDKIQIKAVYLFSDSFPTKPTASLVAGMAPVTDGLVLRITTEGLFIDDDVRHVPQRDWDMKAWTLKLVEDGLYRAGAGTLHVLRTSSRDVENRKHVFVLDEAEAWKVAIGLQRLKKGSQVRSLAMHGMKDLEVKGLLVQLGFV